MENHPAPPPNHPGRHPSLTPAPATAGRRPGRLAATTPTPARGRPLRVDARGLGAGVPRLAARSICPARARVPPAPDLQSVTLPAERRPWKSAPPAPPIESVNAKWSKLTRRQSPRLQVGEAPYSLHSPAQCSLQAPIQAGLHAKEPAIRSS